MSKPYNIPEETPLCAHEPVVAYRVSPTPTLTQADEVIDRWNPNVPFHGTQEEWWEHFHRIEVGNFTPWEEAKKKFEAWRMEFLASRLK